MNYKTDFAHWLGIIESFNKLLLIFICSQIPLALIPAMLPGERRFRRVEPAGAGCGLPSGHGSAVAPCKIVDGGPGPGEE